MLSSPAIPVWTNDSEYLELKERIQASGFLNKTPLIYWGFFVLLMTLTVLMFYLLTLPLNLPLLIFIAAVFSFPRAWFGYFSHDISHGAVFSSPSFSRRMSIFVWPLSLGVAGDWWYFKHNKHHESPNVIGKDPDLDVPVYFSEKQHNEKNIFQQQLPDAVFHHQHRYFFFLFPLLGFSLYKQTFDYFFFEPFERQKLLEMVLVFLHFVFFYGTIFWLLGFAHGVVFILVNVACAGTLLSLAFAPNHKGEEMFNTDEKITWRHQVITTRNLRPHFLTDFFYGGLNYQVEHHLFPYMSRFNLRKARSIVKPFCEEKGLVYHETSPWGSMVEIYVTLKDHAPKGTLPIWQTNEKSQPLT